MHRSGTSMITRFLKNGNVFFGNTIDKNDESKFFQKINRWILYQAHSRWDLPDNFQYYNDKFINTITKSVQTRLTSIHLKEYLGLNNYLKYRNLNNLDFNWGWKDPRNSITLRVWKKFYPNAHIIHIYRNPIDVAQSLVTRENQIYEKLQKRSKLKEYLNAYFLLNVNMYGQSNRCRDFNQGLKLWEFYVSESLKADQLFSNVIHIKYEDFLDNPKKILEEMSKKLPIEYNSQLINEISKTIKSDRKYAFLNDTALVEIYQKNKKNNLISHLGYSNIV